jgi:hypothetical protein
VAAADPEAAYYQAVEEFFVSRRGDPLFLSSADWHLVRRWRQAGIPLRIVLRGIADALDSHQHSWGRERKVGHLAYCRREVEAAHERWERALALGVSAGLDLGGALLGFARDLERARGLGPLARRAAEEAARGLRARAASPRLAELTPWLQKTEAGLLEALRRDAGEAEITGLEAEVDASLAAYRDRMPAAVLGQVRQESLARRLLAAHGLPRLSLFHLDPVEEHGA